MREKSKGLLKLELPPWIRLPTDDYDTRLVSAQDIVSRMSAQEKMEAMDRIADAFKNVRR